jgi:hypothetical protein
MKTMRWTAFKFCRRHITRGLADAVARQPSFEYPSRRVLKAVAGGCGAVSAFIIGF